jgi:hypothetical protein
MAGYLGKQPVVLTTTLAEVNGDLTVSGDFTSSSLDVIGQVRGDTGQFDGAVNIDGTLTSDGLTVDGNQTLNGDLKISDVAVFINMVETDVTDLNTRLRSANGDFYIETINDALNSATVRLNVDHATGDISFYEDTGTTPKFFWDASAESLGIGTDSPSAVLHVSSGDPEFILTDTGTGVDHSLDGNSGSGYLRLHVDKNSEGSDPGFIINVANSEAMRIDSSGSVGIGTSSPAADLHVNSGATNLAGLFESTDAGATITLIDNGTTGGSVAEHGLNTVGDQLEIRAVDNLSFETGGAGVERMRIDSSGQVGIGTSLPSYQLQIENATTNDGLFIGATGNSVNKRIVFGNSTSVGKAAIATTNEATFGRKALNFYTNSVADNTTDIDYANPRMIITNTGNLLVGKTVTSVATAGHALMSSGQQRATVDGDITSIYNRLTSDGDIVQFRKANTTVGSIGSRAGVTSHFIADPRAGGSGITGVGTQIRSTDNTGALANGTIDLGGSGNRFKDLYLSGGVYLGGTGSANYLEDYEEGTWDPFYHGSTGNPTCTYDVQAGYYTKVGRQVTCHGRLRTDAVSGGSGLLSIGGLPFTSMNVNGNGSGGTVTIGSYLAFKSGEFAPKMGYVTEQTTTALLRYEANDNSAGNCEVDALNNTTNDNDILFSISYITTE